MDIYVVGGAVRDALLGRGETDRDYVVLGATHEEFVRRYPSARQVGKAFPVYLVDGREYAWPREPSLEGDLRRRDLTVNALAAPELEGGELDLSRLAAHPKALADIRDKILRPASESSLADDPARVFRAARFAAQWPEFSTSPELLDRMRDCAAKGLLEAVIPERVGKELVLALAAPAPSLFLDVLFQGGCLAPWFSPLDAARAIPAGPAPYHDRDLLGHTMLVMDRLAPDALCVWMGLAHDLGKTATDAAIWPKHHGHEQLGEELAVAMGERLKLPARFIKAGALAAKLHMNAGRYLALRPGSRVDLLQALNAAELVEPMLALAAADRHAASGEEFGIELGQAARADLAAMLAVHLPEEDQDQGAASGARLRELRCLALAEGDGRGGGR